MSNWRFHHVGIACRDLEREARGLAPVGFVQVGPSFEDPIQGVRGRFLEGPGPRLELVSPISSGSILESWLSRGAKMYHLCFEVPDLSSEIQRLTSARARIVTGPVPAVAFGGRPIAFVILPTLMLIELLQAQN